MKSSKHSPRDHGDAVSPLVWKVASVAVLGSLLSQLDATIVNVSLSSLTVVLHSSLDVVQWVTSGYLLALALVLPLSGWLVDRVGARTVYLWSFAAFTASSALCGTAWSIHTLIGFRILQGITGGLLAPMAQMMIASVAGRHMARVMGYAALPVMFGPILGPVLAGFILQHASWRWLFFVNVPFGLLALLLAIFFLPKERETAHARSLDLLGLALLSPALVLFLFGLDHASSLLGKLSIVMTCILLPLFLYHAAQKGEDAIIDLALFRKPVFRTGSMIMFLANGATFTGQMLFPLLLIRVFGYTPVMAGAGLVPQGLGMLCTYPLVGTLTQRFGVRNVAFTGTFLAMIGTLPLIGMAMHPPSHLLLAMTLFLRGLGLGSVGVPAISAAYASIPKPQLPMATTTLNILQRIGGPTFTTFCAILLTWKIEQHLVAAFCVALAFLSCLHFVIGIHALFLPGRGKHAPQP